MEKIEILSTCKDVVNLHLQSVGEWQLSVSAFLHLRRRLVPSFETIRFTA